MNLRKNLKNKPLFILGLNILVYFFIFFIRKKFFGPYGSIEYELWLPSPYSLPFIGCFLFLYFWGYKNLKRFSLKLLIWGYLIFSFILIFTPVLLSTDIYIYAARGRVYSIYHQNPYLEPVANFPGDPFLEFTVPAWRKLPQNYAPLWTIFSAGLTWLAGNNINLTFSLFKLWAFLGVSLVLVLIYKIGKIYNPERAKEAFFLFAWNPFVLIEFVNNAHNDIWMIFFGVLAFYFYYTRKDSLIIPALTLAGLVKYIFWLLIPFFLILLFKEKRINLKVFTIGGVISLLFLVSFYLPFWAGKDTFVGIIEQSGFQNRSPNQWSPLPLLGAFLLGPLFFPSQNFPLWLGRAVFSVFYLKQILLNKEAIDASILILTFFALLATGTLLPWYLTWWLPFLALKNKWQASLLWTSIGLGAYFFFYSTSLALVIIGGFWLAFSKILTDLRKFKK